MLILACCAASVMYLMHFGRDMAYYNEAEEYVPKVWALAQEMKRYSVNQGRLPDNIQEIDEYSTTYDFHDLGRLNPVFRGSLERPLYIRINPRYGFSISSDFRVEWLKF